MAAPNGDDAIVEFRDARRRVLARSLPVVIGDDGVARARVSLRPRRTGDYWVNAVGGTYTWDYRVSLR